jgi:hypothetical protein
MKLLFISIPVILCLLQSCGNQQQSNDTTALREEIRSRKIVRATPGQITEKALTLGKEISLQADSIWMHQLKSVLDTVPDEGRIMACSIKSNDKIAALAHKYGVTIEKVSASPINPANKANETEASLADAYQYNIENNLPLTGNVQKEDKELIYTKAIIFNDKGCLKCHGNDGTALADAAAQSTIRNVFKTPAFDGRLNQLAGVWSITIPQSEVIKRLSQ